MKIAFVALSSHISAQSSTLAPPLPLGYLAALLEQQRHIVRIYDLALAEDQLVAEALVPLRMFRPHLVVIANAPDASPAALEYLHALPFPAMRLHDGLRECAPGGLAAQALLAAEPETATNEQQLLRNALLALDGAVDALPFPARHLLPLEQYPLRSPHGDLRTTVVIAQHLAAGNTLQRDPAMIVAEIRSIIHEHAIRHFVFPGALSADRDWQHSFLSQLASASLPIGWEGHLRPQNLTRALVDKLVAAGCDALRLEFDIHDVLLSQDARKRLVGRIRYAQQQGITVSAQIHLEAPYSSIPMLVDISATFGIDKVKIHIQKANRANPKSAGDDSNLDDMIDLARSRYRSRRSRQFFVDRFGAQLGPMLWHASRAGLLGRTWQQYAAGSEEQTLAIATA